MKKLIMLIAICISFYGINYAQKSNTIFLQNVRGKIIDADTKLPLIGAAIVIVNSDPIKGAISDDEGNFVMEDVPIGRVSFQISYIGYLPRVLQNIEVVSAKETNLTIELVENAIQLEDIVVKPEFQKNRSEDPLCMVSSRPFSIEETRLFAGSLGDPARMAGNFAGVSSIDDSRNDIIIRGNSPYGLLWRLEGFDIPNPNHYSLPDSKGGPMSMLNQNNLDNSNFITGAFPAEYGNALSGVFDLSLRNGNTSKWEHVFQLGLNGFELGTEGPISKKKSSSVIASFRYSTPEIIALALGNDSTTKKDIGEFFGYGSSVPKYMDFSIKVNFPKAKTGHLEIFALGGTNGITRDTRELDEDEWTYGFQRAVMTMDNKMGVLGVTNTVYLSDKSRWITKFSGQYVDNSIRIDTTISEDSELLKSKVNSREIIGTFHTGLKAKLNAKNFMDFGFDYKFINTDYLIKQINYDGTVPEFLIDMDGITNSLSAYLQYRHKFNNKLSFTVGGKYYYFFWNKTDSKEGRAAIEQKIGKRHSISLGFGMHSKKQENSVYFLQSYDPATDSYRTTNENLELSKSNHYVFTFNSMLAKHLNLKVETYYQNLYDIPVTSKQPQFSMLNTGGSFDLPIQDFLVSQGTGQNYGVELTLEKYLNKNYYFLLTGSLFDSKYKGFDKIERNTEFNGNFITNALFGMDFKITEKYRLGFNFRGVYAGGKRRLPIDLDASINEGDMVYDWNNAYKERFPDYARLDARISIKTFYKKVTDEFAIDITNLTNNKSNMLSEYYNGLTNSIQTDYQQGISFNFMWRLYF